MKLKGLLTFEKKYFNLNVLLYQGKVLQLCSSEITPIKHQIWWTNCKWTNASSALFTGGHSAAVWRPIVTTTAAYGFNTGNKHIVLISQWMGTSVTSKLFPICLWIDLCYHYIIYNNNIFIVMWISILHPVYYNYTFNVHTQTLTIIKC